jgi:LysR family transcriptional regulator, mexEF-oprN operon transcriptional activator
MSDITNNELRRLDLTVLLVFLAMLRHRNATLVAAEMGLTQSGVSQGLKRLRSVFGDPLFLRRPHGMDPTAVALALEPAVTTAVDSLRRALAGQDQFDPVQATGTIRFAAFDAEQATLLPGALRQMCHAAPHLRLSVLALGRAQAVAALMDNVVDIAAGFFWDLPPDVLSTPLYTQGFVVVGRPHLMGDGPDMPMDRYLALPHIITSPRGDLRGVVDDTLARDGLQRDVRASVPQFFPALAMVAETDCLVTLPEGIARRYGAAFGLACRTPPLPLRHFTIAALRHRRDARNARLDWFTGLLASAMPATA